MGVGPGGDHHDRHVARAPDRPADLEAVDAGEHEVDEHDIGGALAEGLEAVLAGRRLVDLVALVLEGEPHRRPDAFVVLDQEEAAGHTQMVSHRRGPRQAIRPGRRAAGARIVTQPKRHPTYSRGSQEG